MGTLEQFRGSERILIVDDDPEVTRGVRRVLERLGYHVRVAANPGQALLVATGDQASIDLAVVDVVLPELNGLALARRLVSLRPGVRILLVSGFTGAEVLSTEEEPFRRRAAFLRKPFTLEELAGRVRELLDDGPEGPGG